MILLKIFFGVLGAIVMAFLWFIANYRPAEPITPEEAESLMPQFDFVPSPQFFERIDTKGDTMKRGKPTKFRVIHRPTGRYLYAFHKKDFAEIGNFTHAERIHFLQWFEKLYERDPAKLKVQQAEPSANGTIDFTATTKKGKKSKKGYTLKPGNI